MSVNANQLVPYVLLIYTPAMQKRNYKPITITIPPDELKEAKRLLPYGEARSLSALVRVALRMLPKKR